MLVGLALFAFFYLVAVGPLRGRFKDSSAVPPLRIVSFVSAIALLFVALVSPLDVISDHYLFSAHMLQHLLIVMALPILLLLGIPGWLVSPLISNPAVRAAARLVTHPVGAYVIFNAVFTAWHLPAIYELQFRSEPFHIATHLLFIATGILTWMPIVSPLRELPRLTPGLQSIYLFFQSIPATGLAAFITLSPRPLYATYANAPRLFGLTPLDDQVLAGLIMWIPGTLVYLGAITVIFFRWFGKSEETADGEMAPVV